MGQSLHRDPPSNNKDSRSVKTSFLLQSAYSEHSDVTGRAVQCSTGWHGFREKLHDRQCDNCGSVLRCCFTLLCFLIVFTGFLCVCYFYSLKLVLYAFKNSCILNYDSSSKRASLGGSVIVYLQCRRHRRHGFNPWVGKIPWRRAWQPTPVFLLGESPGQRSLAGYSPWGHKELDTTERLSTQHASYY